MQDQIHEPFDLFLAVQRRQYNLTDADPIVKRAYGFRAEYERLGVASGQSGHEQDLTKLKTKINREFYEATRERAIADLEEEANDICNDDPAIDIPPLHFIANYQLSGVGAFVNPWVMQDIRKEMSALLTTTERVATEKRSEANTGRFMQQFGRLLPEGWESACEGRLSIDEYVFFYPRQLSRFYR